MKYIDTFHHTSIYNVEEGSRRDMIRNEGAILFLVPLPSWIVNQIFLEWNFGYNYVNF
jgi:hypothetical protein